MQGMTSGMDLKLARTAARIKGTELAAELGVSGGAVTNTEARAIVSAEQAARYMAAIEAIEARRKREAIAQRELVKTVIRPRR